MNSIFWALEHYISYEYLNVNNNPAGRLPPKSLGFSLIIYKTCMFSYIFNIYIPTPYKFHILDP